MNSPIEQGASWRELLTREYLPRLVIMALAIWLHASNSMLTATTMPSAVEEIGGLELISWAFALYLAGSITAAATMSLVVAKSGLAKTMKRAAIVFTIGCIVVALAPNMTVLLCGRVAQGLGGGSLIALVYLCQDRFFPNRLVPKAVALMSTIWMLAAFSGPVIGGAFATLDAWRLAYWTFAAQGLLLVPAVHFLMRESEPEVAIAGERIPIVRLLLLGTAIIMVSMAAAYYHPLGSPLLVLCGILALVLFIYRDVNASAARMLPSEVTDLGHAIGNGILATFLLCVSIMAFIVYGPLIMIELYGLNPLEAGFVVLLESLAWGTASVTFSGTRVSAEPRLIRLGGGCVLAGLIGSAILFPMVSLAGIILATVVLNAGMGMMWGFIIKRVIAAAPADEKDRTSSLLPITQQSGFAIGAALSGLIANGLGIEQQPTPETLKQVAFWMFAGFVPLAFIGNVMAWRFVSRRFEQSPGQAASR